MSLPNSTTINHTNETSSTSSSPSSSFNNNNSTTTTIQPTSTSTTITTNQNNQPIILQPRPSLERFTEIFHEEDLVQYFGGLNVHNVLDYFAESPFYDKRCNNEIVRRQNIRDPIAFRDALQQMEGLEYQLVPCSEEERRLFIIIRQRRSSESLVAKEAVYYVLDHVIFQAPNLEEMIASRARKATEYLIRAFDLLRNDSAPFSFTEAKTFSSLQLSKLTTDEMNKDNKRIKIVEDALENVKGKMISNQQQQQQQQQKHS
jgi:mediator of RNA polymerase II transcription subunit 6